VSENDVQKYLVSKPAHEVTPEFEVRGREVPSMTLMSNNLVPGSNMYVEAGWITGQPDPNPHIHEHTHDYDEIVLHIGIDPKDQEDLGAKITFYLDGQPLTIERTSAVFVPKGMKHGPLVWEKTDRPHIEMTIMVGAGSLAEADPGGHRERIGKNKGK
jgi:hypothetical protein